MAVRKSNSSGSMLNFIQTLQEIRYEVFIARKKRLEPQEEAPKKILPSYKTGQDARIKKK